MIEVIRRVMKRPNNRLEFSGILITMHEPRLELTKEVHDEEQYQGGLDKWFMLEIPQYGGPLQPKVQLKIMLLLKKYYKSYYI